MLLVYDSRRDRFDIRDLTGDQMSLVIWAVQKSRQSYQALRSMYQARTPEDDYVFEVLAGLDRDLSRALGRPGQ